MQQLGNLSKQKKKKTTTTEKNDHLDQNETPCGQQWSVVREEDWLVLVGEEDEEGRQQGGRGHGVGGDVDEGARLVDGQRPARRVVGALAAAAAAALVLTPVPRPVHRAHLHGVPWRPVQSIRRRRQSIHPKVDIKKQ